MMDRVTLRPSVPPVPYLSGPVERNTDKCCAACRHSIAHVHLEVHAGIQMLLCDDYRACNRRSGVIKR